MCPVSQQQQQLYSLAYMCIRMYARMHLYIYFDIRKRQNAVNESKKKYCKKKEEKKISAVLTKRCRRKYHKCQQKQISFLVADHITFCVSAVFFI